jgi:hypothetical protein
MRAFDFGIQWSVKQRSWRLNVRPMMRAHGGLWPRPVSAVQHLRRGSLVAAVKKMRRI